MFYVLRGVGDGSRKEVDGTDAGSWGGQEWQERWVLDVGDWRACVGRGAEWVWGRDWSRRDEMEGFEVGRLVAGEGRSGVRWWLFGVFLGSLESLGCGAMGEVSGGVGGVDGGWREVAEW